MAILISDKLKLSIAEIESYLMDEDHSRPTYEQFKIEIKMDGKEAVSGVNGYYELCDGNIEGLIKTIENVLYNPDIKQDEIEFCEPDFRFEVKKDKFKDPYSERAIEYFDLICWINSGQWNGIYSSTEIGCKFTSGRAKLKGFLNSLQREWDNRKIMNYKDKINEKQKTI